ncbi:AI-2E family transporter [Longispora albida]|uniref:AI-2E family transporter n=1 Tax=Longispora albida TaxID=203523 RepID=UPI000367F8DA|nr:AI-2E family transporter [Longispora albida]
MAVNTEPGTSVSEQGDEPGPASAEDGRPWVTGVQIRRVAALSAVATASGLAVWAAAQGLLAIRGLLTLAGVALFAAVSLDPVVRWLCRHRLPRPWAVAVTAGSVFLLIAGFVASVVPILIDQGGRLAGNLPAYLETAREQSRAVRDLGDRLHLTGQVSSLLGDLPGKAGPWLLAWGGRLLGGLASALLAAVLTVYFMLDLPRIRRGVVALFPPASRPAAARVVAVVVDKVGAYMIGNLIISAIAGVAALPVLVLLDVPYAAVLAVIVAVTDLIPLVGALLGAAASVAVAAFSGGLWPDAIVVALFFLLYQQLENYVIAPRVLRDAANLPALVVLLTGLFGGALLGLAGVLMAVPVAAAVKVVLDDRRRDPVS